MTKRHIATIVTLAVPLAMLAACSQQPDPAAEAPSFHEVMKTNIDGPADALWDVSNAAIGAEGGLDPALMDDARWSKIADLADQVASGARQIAAMDPIVVAAPGVTIADSDVSGGHSAAQVQAAIDRDPQLLRELANSLSMHVEDLAAAARAHDAKVAGPLIDQLDSVCESCHLDFWYPEQKDLVEQFQNEGVIDPNHPALGPARTGE